MKNKVVIGVLSICTLMMCFQMGRFVENPYAKIQNTVSRDNAIHVEESEENSKILSSHIMYDDDIWVVKAYCTCEKCCGKDKEPVGAMGVKLESGYSCAAASDIPYDTTLMVDGYGRVCVQDRIPSSIQKENANSICIYFDSHDEAVAFGLKQTSVQLVAGE